MNILRIVLHSSAAVVWFGAVALGLADKPSRRVQAAGWTSFAVLIVTGLWAAFSLPGRWAGSGEAAQPSLTVQMLFFVKICAAVGSGATAAVAVAARNPKIRQGAAITALVFAVIAALIGAQLAPVL